MDYRDKIEQYIDSRRQEMLEDICTLCRINSEKMPYKEGYPFGQGVGDALETALSMAESYGFSIKNYDNYVGTADLNDGEPCLDILAHLDVVPAGEGWQVTEPFEPVEKDGKLYGRGTADDKGPAVAALYAMRAVKELGLPVSKKVRLILGTDEECGSSDIPHYYAVEKEAPMTFSPDASFPVINTEKGMFRGQFTAQWEKSEALPRLVSIQAGTKINVVPGKADAVFMGVEADVLEAAAKEVSKETGILFHVEYSDYTKEAGDMTAKVTAEGKGAHAAYPHEGNNALTGLVMLANRLPLAACRQTELLKELEACLPHGDIRGKALGIQMEDEVSGPLTLAFSLLTVTETGLEGSFDSRCPICANEENVLKPAKSRMETAGFKFVNDHMIPPYHVPGDSNFV